MRAFHGNLAAGSRRRRRGSPAFPTRLLLLVRQEAGGRGEDDWENPPHDSVDPITTQFAGARRPAAGRAPSPPLSRGRRRGRGKGRLFYDKPPGFFMFPMLSFEHYSLSPIVHANNPLEKVQIMKRTLVLCFLKMGCLYHMQFLKFHNKPNKGQKNMKLVLLDCL